MSVIIRLQNLPWSANALDIRQYFQGLSIPEGGVHIVGGELGDAFIAFSTDEDARQAFNLNNGKVKGVQIKLMLSSRTEMQKVIEAARSQSLAAFMQTSQPPRIPPAVATILPSVVPSAVPEIKKETKDKDLKNDKRDKRRSRSRSRDRKERSRERDRRDRRRKDRSRSRSRDRRDRRRRDRSRSRDRTRSKERDHRRKDLRSPDKSPMQNNLPKEKQVIWEAPPLKQTLLPPTPAANLLAFPGLLAAQSLLQQQDTSFQSQSRDGFQTRWNPTITKPSPTNNFQPLQNRFQQEDRFGNQNRTSTSTGTGTTGTGTGTGIGIGSRPPNQPTFEAPSTFNRSIPPRSTNNNTPNLNNRFNSNDRDNRGVIKHDPKNCCVQLQSYMGGFGEVRRFFQGLFIHSTGIKFVNDNFGKRTGLVYIRFATPEGKVDALRRNGGMLRGQTVKVIHLDDDIFDNTVDRYHPNMFDEEVEQPFMGHDGNNFFNKTPFTALIVEDLPNYAKEQDILKMFSDYSLMSIILLNKPRKVTLAYVKFSNPEDAKLALQDENKHIVDGKVVTVKPCKDEEFEIVQREETGFSEPMPPVEPFKNSNILLLSRLPLKTTDRDVSDFFSDIGIIPRKVHLLTNNMGFMGEAFCEFNNVNDAKTAMQKNGMPMGTSVVSVKSVEKEEMENVLGIQKEEEQEEMEDLHKMISERSDMRGDVIDMQNDGNDMHIRNDFQPRMPNLRPPIGMNQQMRPMFPMRNNFMNNGGPMPRGPNFMGPRPRRFPPPHIQHVNGSEDVFGPPGCTVLMENVPFQATIEEILDFFEGYDVPADNILRRYNPNGKPSGESKVIFKNADDAYQAVHEKQELKIRDRTIYLTLC